ncbi:MAG TPA: hypothetical protein VIT42_13500, partial [Microlunatus sp.]
TALEKVNTTSAAVGQAMYAAAQAEQNQAPADAGAPSDNPSGNGSSSDSATDDDVVDAEIVDESDESKSSGTK